jgi:Na+:H+ antiporter, NhaC family
MPPRAPSQPHQNPAVVRAARLGESILPVLALIAMIYVSVVRFDTYPHLALILATAVAGVVGLRMGYRWTAIEEGILGGIAIGLKAILILMIIGMLIATWIQGGVVPVMIDLGLRLLSPNGFLAAACGICCVVSISTGSSWTTAGTVGVALIGIGQGLGVPLPMVAGAIVSGAYFGDKLSPLSDTTNLAPAVAGTDLFDHLRYLLHTTIPALVLTLGLYLVIGRRAGGESTVGGVEAIRTALGEGFTLSPFLWLPPVLVIAMVVFRMPAIPSLLGGACLGGVFAGWLQGCSLREIFRVAFEGYTASTGNEAVDELLSRGGLISMMNTVALIVTALGFGGVMERTGQLAALGGAVLRFARNTGSLVGATAVTCIGMNIIAPDQYLSIVVPGRMYRGAYKEAGLPPWLLSRTLEDAGTLSSPLVAWNTCGAFMGTTLGVSALAYAPYAFFNLLCPIIAVVIASFGWGLAKRR